MASMQFPLEFRWGAATAAYQIEGAVHEDGRGESIWDRFCHGGGVVDGGDTGDVACDHYHKWRDDVDNMKALGLSAYRFSISWPRIFPEGRGACNRKGVDFYSRLVDALLRNGIEPVVTLYHWDLPQALQEKGGWLNRDTPRYFAEYADTLYKAFGARVKTWITLNEPQAAAFMGYAVGGHAPGIKDFASYVQVCHLFLIAHALAVQAYREEKAPGGRIGIALNLAPVYPYTDSGEDAAAADFADVFHNRSFLDPVFRGQYPQGLIDHYRAKGVAPRAEAGDFALLESSRPDFLGVNYYFPLRVYRREDHHPILGFESKLPPGCAKTEMGWEIFPRGLHDLLMRIVKDYGCQSMSITENGIACRDESVVHGQVQDEDRIEYLRSHLLEALRAIHDGAKIEGYYVWSLMDNFEWAHGYSKRFGITHTDYGAQTRTWKSSANWYRRVIDTKGESLG
jgi:beta-glucosidase